MILGQFVVERFLSEARMAAAAGGIGAGGVNHVAHLAGALVGVALRLDAAEAPAAGVTVLLVGKFFI